VFCSTTTIGMPAERIPEVVEAARLIAARIAAKLEQPREQEAAAAG
jgi:hypothetical protein